MRFVWRWQFVVWLSLLTFNGCAGGANKSAAQQLSNANSAQISSAAKTENPQIPPKQNTAQVVHVVVALCDNEFQGIVPVPAKIGNGDDPANNLYWGAGYGVKTVLRRSKDWQLLASAQNPKPAVLERLIFKHKTKNVLLVADAYRGREIKQSTVDFLNFAAGRNAETITAEANSKTIEFYAGGAANLSVYIGHDGLMDFELPEFPGKADERARDAIVLACISKRYFAAPLKAANANPLIWTTGLMAPEAYILEAALAGWVLDEPDAAIKARAAASYHKYQNCGLRAANKLFATGW